MNRIDDFFARYEQAANNFDPVLTASLYTREFLAADPNGVSCGRNDPALARAMSARRTLFDALGFQQAKVLDVVATTLDEHYTMAKVHWFMRFAKAGGPARDFRFFITYFLYDPGDGPKAAFWISHEDEQRVMREAGLIDEAGSPL
ncbi:MAG: hypothetical protein ACN6O2_08775 [Stenotrophomonas sp.]